MEWFLLNDCAVITELLCIRLRAQWLSARAAGDEAESRWKRGRGVSPSGEGARGSGVGGREIIFSSRPSPFSAKRVFYPYALTVYQELD